MKKTLLYLSIFISSFIFSQDNGFLSSNSGFRIAENNWFKNAFNDKESNIIGSPYQQKDYRKSKIGNYPDVVMTRYNIYTDQIEFLKDEKPFVLPKVDKYYKIDYLDNNEQIVLINDKYYFLIFEGSKFSTLKKLKSIFKDAVPAKGGYVEAQPAKFENSESFYIVIENKLIEVPKNSKKFVEIFPSKKSELSDFIKKGNLDTNNEKDLRTISVFLDQ